MNHAALATRLPTIDSGIARLQTRLLASLDGAPAAVGSIRAGSSTGTTPPAIRFTTSAGDVEISPLLVDGLVPMLVADDGRPDAANALAALGGLEPLVVVIERQLGVALRPVSVGAPSGTVRVLVELVDETGEVRHAAVLAIAADAGFALETVARPLAERTAHLRVALAFVGSGPLLPVARIDALSRGDLVLVGGSCLAGHIEAGGRRLPADYRPAKSNITITDQESNRVSDDEDRSALDAGMQLPLTLRIEAGNVSLGDLAQLSPGSVHPLGIEGATLPVTLEIGGSPVAAGELVAVGDAYGVLITRRFGQAG